MEASLKCGLPVINNWKPANNQPSIFKKSRSTFGRVIYLVQKKFCVPITFNNPLKACFSNKKFFITINTPGTN